MSDRMFNPARLNQQVVVQTRTNTVSGGISTESWADLRTVWAEVEEIRGTRALEMDAYTATSRARVWVRDTTDSAAIRPESHRLSWDSRIWLIQSNVRLTIERGLREMFCEEWIGE